MFTNKHVTVAMLVAPLLAILAWFAVGQLTSEKPHRAVPGQSYPLVEKSNCRWASGACDLENEDLQLRLTVERSPAGRQHMVLSASHPLQGVMFALGAPDGEAAPTMMRAADDQGLRWELVLGRLPGAGERIRLVARAQGSSYFAEASTTFLEPGEEGR